MIDPTPTPAADAGTYLTPSLFQSVVIAVITALVGALGWLAKSVQAKRKAKADEEKAEKEKLHQQRIEVRKEDRADFQTILEELKAQAKANMDTTQTLSLQIGQMTQQIADLERENEIKDEKLELSEQRYEAILLQNDRHYLRLLDELGIAFWKVDKNERFKSANHTFLDVTGINPSDIANCNWFDAVKESDRDRVSGMWQRFKMADETRVEMAFSFENLITHEQTKVHVTLHTVYALGAEIYEYTARTRPIQRIAIAS